MINENITQYNKAVSLIGPATEFNEYSHITITFDGSELTLYINGMLIDSATDYNSTYYPSSHFELSDSSLRVSETFDGLNMSMGNKNSESTEGLVGSLDNVLIYGTALSEQEVSELWQGGGGFIIMPQNPDYYEVLNYNNISFEAIVISDTNISYCTLNIDGTEHTTIDSPEIGSINFGTFEINNTGTHYWNVICENTDGQIKESPIWEFSFDFINPTYSSIVYGSTVIPGGMFVIFSTWSDENPSAVYLKEDGQILYPYPWIYSPQLTPVYAFADNNPGGTMIFTLMGEDKAENQNETYEIIIQIEGNATENETMEEPEEEIPGEDSNGGGGGTPQPPEDEEESNGSQEQEIFENATDGNASTHEETASNIISTKTLTFIIGGLELLTIIFTIIVYKIQRSKNARPNIRHASEEG